MPIHQAGWLIILTSHFFSSAAGRHQLQSACQLSARPPDTPAWKMICQGKKREGGGGWVGGAAREGSCTVAPISPAPRPPHLTHFLHSIPLPPLSCTAVTGLPGKLIYGKRRKKNYKCRYSPSPAAQFSGLRRAGEVEFVIIAREGGADNKGTLFP